MGKALRVLSTFSGICAASVAFAGMPIEVVACAEVDPYACHLLHARLGCGRPKYMPDPGAPGLTPKQVATRLKAIADVADLPEVGFSGMTNFGDISQITDDDLRELGRIDILEGGSPCQPFSAAGNRKGLEDPRGNLMLVFCELANRMKEINGATYVLWENVDKVLNDKTNAFGYLLGALAGYAGGELVPPKHRRWSSAGHLFGKGEISVAWRVQNAEFHGVAQRRKRVFALASFGGVDAGEVLFEPHGVQQYEKPTRPPSGIGEEPEADGSFSSDGAEFGYPLSPVFGITDYSNVSVDVMPTLQARKGTGGRMDAVVYALNGFGTYKRDGLPCLRRTGGDNGHGSEALVVVRSAGFSRGNSANARSIAWTEEGTPPLRAGSSGTNQVPTVAAMLANAAGAIQWVARRLMPVECERLMGFPDGWTAIPFRGKEIAADTNRYQGIGNSIAVPVVRWIARRL